MRNTDPKLDRIRLHSAKHLVHVKHIIFQAPFRANLDGRCFFCEDEYPIMGRYSDTELAPPLVVLGKVIYNNLFTHLKNGSLRSFRQVPSSSFGKPCAHESFFIAGISELVCQRKL